MIAWFKSLFGKKEAQIGVVALPLEVGTGIRVDRNIERLKRLEAALEGETDKKRKKDLEFEIARRKQFGR